MYLAPRQPATSPPYPWGRMELVLLLNLLAGYWCDMVCYFIIFAVKLSLAVCPGFTARSGAGNTDLQGLERLDSAARPARGARTGYKFLVAPGS